MAWFAAILLSPYTKGGRMVDPQKLLPVSMRTKQKPKTKEEIQDELAEIRRSVGIK